MTAFKRVLARTRNTLRRKIGLGLDWPAERKEKREQEVARNVQRMHDAIGANLSNLPGKVEPLEKVAYRAARLAEKTRREEYYHALESAVSHLTSRNTKLIPLIEPLMKSPDARVRHITLRKLCSVMEPGGYNHPLVAKWFNRSLRTPEGQKALGLDDYGVCQLSYRQHWPDILLPHSQSVLALHYTDPRRLHCAHTFNTQLFHVLQLHPDDPTVRRVKDALALLGRRGSRIDAGPVTELLRVHVTRAALGHTTPITLETLRSVRTAQKALADTGVQSKTHAGIYQAILARAFRHPRDSLFQNSKGLRLYIRQIQDAAQRGRVKVA